MSTISLRLPESLHKQARELAKKEDISINQLIATAGQARPPVDGDAISLRLA